MISNHHRRLRTKAEATQYKETSRHTDVLSFVEQLSTGNPFIHRTSIGHSGEGQEIVAMIVSDGGCHSREKALQQKKTIVMVEANIHAGEVEGKESVLALARDLTTTSLGKTLLSKLCLVLIPNFNPDGNDRISPKNRALNLQTLEGQVNPEGGVGTRYTGEGWNLNRDSIKQEAIETRNLAKFYQAWQPDVFIDCHTTDGSLHGFDLTYDTSRSNQHLFGKLHAETRSLLETTGEKIHKKYGFRSFWYGNYVVEDEPSSGWHTYPTLPRFGSHYRGLLGKIDILLETYSYISFEKRCNVTYAWLLELFREIARRGSKIRSAIEAEEQRIIQRGLMPDPTVQVGIQYGVAKRDEDGALLFDYPAYAVGGDTADIVSFDMDSIRRRIFPGKKEHRYTAPHHRTFIPISSVTTPMAYVVPEELSSRLELHGIEYQRITKALSVDVEAYRILAMEKTFSPDVAGRVPPKGQAEIPLSVKVPPRRFETVLSVRAERRHVSVEKGSLIVSTAQPRGTLAVYLLEPHSDDGFARWEFLDHKLNVGADYPVYRLLSLDVPGIKKQRPYKAEA